MGLDKFITKLKESIDLLREAGEEVLIVHHNDADGLASTAVLLSALSKEGFRVKTIALERVHPPIVERLHADYDSTIIYLDLGGRAAPMISEANRGRNLTLILDHHPAEEPADPRVHNLSTELFELSGERDISAATAAYLFAKTIDEGNANLAYLGVIGAVGDGHDRGGYLIGENRRALEEAERQGDIAIDKANGKERYILKRFGRPIPVEKLARSLTTLGAAGYYINGPQLGIRVCLEGGSKESEQKLEGLEEIKGRAFAKVIANLCSGGLKQSKYIQWFHVHDGFEPMGVKIIGELCMQIRGENFIDPNKYIAGFQDMGKVIPGLGGFDWDLVKVSMRVPAPLEEKILRDKTMPGLAYLLPEAAKAVGGSIDACHDYAAAALIPKGSEERLIAEMDGIIEEETR